MAVERKTVNNMIDLMSITGRGDNYRLCRPICGMAVPFRSAFRFCGYAADYQGGGGAS